MRGTGAGVGERADTKQFLGFMSGFGKVIRRQPGPELGGGIPGSGERTEHASGRLVRRCNRGLHAYRRHRRDQVFEHRSADATPAISRRDRDLPHEERPWIAGLAVGNHGPREFAGPVGENTGVREVLREQKVAVGRVQIEAGNGADKRPELRTINNRGGSHGQGHQTAETPHSLTRSPTGNSVTKRDLVGPPAASGSGLGARRPGLCREPRVDSPRMMALPLRRAGNSQQAELSGIQGHPTLDITRL